MKSVHFLSASCCDLVIPTFANLLTRDNCPSSPKSSYLKIVWPDFRCLSRSFSLDIVNLHSIYSKDPSVQLSLRLLLSLRMMEEVTMESTVTIIFRV